MSVRLWSYYRSSCSFRVRIGLNLKGIKHEIVPVNLLDGAQKSDDYVKQNPQGLVPLLEIDGLKITQSGAMLEYIQERYPEKGMQLIPKLDSMYDSVLADRAKARAASMVITCDTQPLSNLGTMKALNVERKGFGVEFATNAMVKGITAFEKLMEGPFLLGNQLSMADIALVPQLHNARRFGVDIASFPKVAECERKCYELEAFLDAHPYNQPDCPEKLRGMKWDEVEAK